MKDIEQELVSKVANYQRLKTLEGDEEVILNNLVSIRDDVNKLIRRHRKRLKKERGL